MEDNIEFENCTISEIYTLGQPASIKFIKTEIDYRNNIEECQSFLKMNPPTNKNIQENKLFFESDFKYNYNTFRDLNIDEKTKIYFETIENNDPNRVNDEKKLYELYKENGFNKQDDKIYIILVIESIEYPLQVHKNTQFEDVIFILKQKFPDLIKIGKNMALFNSNNLLSNENRNLTIEQLKIKEHDIITIT